MYTEGSDICHDVFYIRGVYCTRTPVYVQFSEVLPGGANIFWASRVDATERLSGPVRVVARSEPRSALLSQGGATILPGAASCQLLTDRTTTTLNLFLSILWATTNVDFSTVQYIDH